MSSRSPRSLTKTRSESETRIRSNGSAIWVAAIGSVCDVAASNEERESERASKWVDFAPRCTARTDRRIGHSTSSEDAPTEPLPTAAPPRRTLRVVVPRESRLRLGRQVTQQHATRLQLRRHGQVLLRLLRRKSSRESRPMGVSNSQTPSPCRSQVFLTHDSSSVRRAHNSGRNHLSNVRDYYASAFSSAAPLCSKLISPN